MKTYKCKKSYVVFTVLGCLAVLIPFCIISFVIDKTRTARFVWPVLVLIYIMFSLVPQVKTVYKNPTEVHDDYVQFPYMRGVYDVKYRDVREIKYSARTGKPLHGGMTLMLRDGSKVSIPNVYDGFPELSRTVIDRIKRDNPHAIVDERANRYLYNDEK